MDDMWEALEEHTRAWRDRERQAVADTVWADYVTARFSRTGDPRALHFLYPYLNRAERHVRTRALGVAARVFEGCGPKALGHLDYFTANSDPFLRDRAAVVVGGAMTGRDPAWVLDALAPYLAHGNRFIQRTAVEALGHAAARSADERVLDALCCAEEAAHVGREPLALAVARVFEGKPNERAYGLVADPDPEHVDCAHDNALGILIRGASATWYERACKEVFDRRLGAVTQRGDWERYFQPRAGVCAMGDAGTGRGIGPFRRMLVGRSHRPEIYAMLQAAQKCFHGADVDVNRDPLLELVSTGDVATQRAAAVCLGRLLLGSGDAAVTDVLTRLTRARNQAVRAAAIRGLGMVAQSTRDQTVATRCLELMDDEETATAAIGALGRIHLGSGSPEVFAQLQTKTQECRHRPAIGRRRYLPLQVCYRATGRLFLGTGSTEPVEFLLDPIVQSRSPADSYRWTAGAALVMVEFPGGTLERIWGPDWEP